MKWHFWIPIVIGVVYSWHLAWKAGMRVGSSWTLKALYWFVRYKGSTSEEAKRFISELGLFVKDEEEFIKKQLYERNLDDLGTSVEPGNVQEVV